MKDRKKGKMPEGDVAERLMKVAGHKKGDARENKTEKMLSKTMKDRKQDTMPERDDTERLMKVAGHKKGDKRKQNR